MKFESIKNKKFQTLAKSEMNKVNGGTCTVSPGGTTGSGFKYSCDTSGGGSSTFYGNASDISDMNRALLAGEC